MSRPGGIFKNDEHARRLWGDAYDAIPKSVFALVAWHLANAMSGAADSEEAAERAFIAELEALRDGRHLSKLQADRAIKAIIAEIS